MTASAPQPAPLRILIVDDHVDAARALSRLLRHKGCVVITAHTVTGALTLVVGQQPVDLLISDIGLPDGDGCDLLVRLRAFYGGRDVAAVALSGADDDALVERCRRAGYCQFLIKPITFEKVLEAVQILFPAARTTPASPVPNGHPLGGVPGALATE